MAIFIIYNTLFLLFVVFLLYLVIDMYGFKFVLLCFYRSWFLYSLLVLFIDVLIRY